jgi:hypothetical protein
LGQPALGFHFAAHLFHHGEAARITPSDRYHCIAQPLANRHGFTSIFDVGTHAIRASRSSRNQIEHHEGVSRSLRHLRQAIKQRRQIEIFGHFQLGKEIGLEHAGI